MLSQTTCSLEECSRSWRGGLNVEVGRRSGMGGEGRRPSRSCVEAAHHVHAKAHGHHGHPHRAMDPVHAVRGHAVRRHMSSTQATGARSHRSKVKWAKGLMTSSIHIIQTMTASLTATLGATGNSIARRTRGSHNMMGSKVLVRYWCQ